jgi:chlorophyll/bacteriochlorophyll a synthase
MDRSFPAPVPSTSPAPRAVLELLKPVTWFAPMWAFGCGIVSSGLPVTDRLWTLVAGIALCGPLVCGTSQAVNDWFDRHVDAINEPNRPIPSGRVPGRWGLGIAIIWSLLSLLVATSLGVWVLMATIFGLAAAWAYSAPPFRLKTNGWWGNAAVGLCYEGLPWFTAAAAMLTVRPPVEVIVMALLYSIGAHGIMTLNDFKAVEGDTRMGIRSLPVQLGVPNAARLACVVMAVPQVVVAGLLFKWNLPVYAGVITASLLLQFICMRKMLRDPKGLAPWYNATGVTLYVLGMLAAAIAIRGGVQ